MKKEILYYLYKEHEEAVDYCNKEAPEGEKDSFDPALIPENFAEDMATFCFYVMGADDDISLRELDKVNSILEDFGLVFSYEVAKEAMDYLKEDQRERGPFANPKTLIILVLRSKMKVFFAAPEVRDEIMKHEIGYLDTIICIYADLMSSIVGKPSEKEKQVILDCLQHCCDYVADHLHVPFPMSDKVKGIVNAAH